VTLRYLYGTTPNVSGLVKDSSPLALPLENTIADVTITEMLLPDVSINQAVGQADPTNVSPMNFTVIFSEPVTGFSRSGVTISGTTGGTKTVMVTGGPMTYNVAVIDMTSSGTVIAALSAGAAQDSAGNWNTASTSTDNSVAYDTTVPH
jgi:serine protease AprX